MKFKSDEELILNRLESVIRRCGIQKIYQEVISDFPYRYPENDARFRRDIGLRFRVIPNHSFSGSSVPSFSRSVKDRLVDAINSLGRTTLKCKVIPNNCDYIRGPHEKVNKLIHGLFIGLCNNPQILFCLCWPLALSEIKAASILKKYE